MSITSERLCFARMLLPVRPLNEIDRRNLRVLRLMRGWKSSRMHLRGPQIALELRGSTKRQWGYFGDGLELSRTELLVFKPAFYAMGRRS